MKLVAVFGLASMSDILNQRVLVDSLNGNVTDPLDLFTGTCRRRKGRAIVPLRAKDASGSLVADPSNRQSPNQGPRRQQDHRKEAKDETRLDVLAESDANF